VEDAGSGGAAIDADFDGDVVVDEFVVGAAIDPRAAASRQGEHVPVSDRGHCSAIVQCDMSPRFGCHGL